MFLLVGTAILAIALVIWRSAYEWIIGLAVFREHVYVLGSGERARTVVETLRTRRDAGMEVVNIDREDGSFNGDLRTFCGRPACLLRKPKSPHRPRHRCHGRPARVDAGS